MFIEPTIGRIVLYRDTDYNINGDTEFPAMITHVTNQKVVNLIVFPNGLAPKVQLDVMHKEEVEMVDVHFWRWPPKV